MGSAALPLPTIQFEPADLTSVVDSHSLPVGIYNLGDPVGKTVLETVAGAIHLSEWPGGNEVPIATAIHDADSAPYGSDGFAEMNLRISL